jgi:hypothetical protein
VVKLGLLVVTAFLGACVADDTTVPPIERDEAQVDTIDLIEQDSQAEFCALAAELPETDMCSLICDPNAFKARLVDGGMKGGNCYAVRCTLSAEVSVTVGVCIP